MTPLSPAACNCVDSESADSKDQGSQEIQALASNRAAGTVKEKSSSHSSGDSRTDLLASSDLAACKEIWMLEQRIVSALVSMKPDPPENKSIIQGCSDFPFHLVPDSHKDVFSFSSSPELYGGVDVSFANPSSSAGDEHEDSEIGEEAVAVYVIIDRRTMKVVYRGHEFFKLTVPYIPTFLAFREIAPLERLVQQQIQNRPEVTPKAILVDGNGILHPRHAGLACFLGVRTDIPTIGIGKSLFYEGGWTKESVDDALDEFVKDVHGTIGNNLYLAKQLADCRGLLMKKISDEADDPAEIDHDADIEMKPPGCDRKGAIQQLAPFCSGMAVPLQNRKLKEAPEGYDNEDEDLVRFSVLGCALVAHGGHIAASDHLPPRGGTSKPIFVSVGHKISLQEATQVAASVSLCRIPEPVRQADLYGRQLIREREEASLKPVASKEQRQTSMEKSFFIK